MRMTVRERRCGNDIWLTGVIFAQPMIAAKTHFLVRSLENVRFRKANEKRWRGNEEK